MLWMKCRAMTSSGWPSFSYMARKNSGSMITIIPIAARLKFPALLSRKKDGTPMSAPAPKQTSCRFVRPKNTLVFTRVRSRGTEIYEANPFDLLSRRQRDCRRYPLVGGQYALCDAAGLEQREHQQDGVAHHAPDAPDDVVGESDGLH